MLTLLTLIVNSLLKSINPRFSVSVDPGETFKNPSRSFRRNRIIEKKKKNNGDNLWERDPIQGYNDYSRQPSNINHTRKLINLIKRN